jgi:UDP-2,4-diacetamido-2,4,6-trideoxy-beta-L-altropyranose hydrolase
MKVAIRTDASTEMGSGHVMRCMTLAEALKNNGASVIFISSKHSGNLNHLIVRKGFQIIELEQPENKKIINLNNGDDYIKWLGVSQMEDAEETINAIKNDKPEWLVVDHYSIDEKWENELRPHVNKLLVIDDIANRRHNCDVLLDQNYSPNGTNRYDGKIPKKTKTLIGPNYALLSPEYFKARKSLRQRSGTIERVLIFMGGSDPDNLTTLVLQSFTSVGLQAINLDVVIGFNNTNGEAIRALCELRGRAQCHTSLPHLANLMLKADLCIGAGGSTTWERFCLGLPTIVITTGANQVHTTEALSASDFIEYLGTASTVSAEILEEKIRQMINSPELLVRQSVAGQKLIDGLGAGRVAMVIK